MNVDDRLAVHLDKTPDIKNAAFIASSADIQGDVVLGRDSSVFYQCVLRGDIHEIRIGEGTNIQDSTIVHLADDAGVQVGDYCTVGHRALLHACTIGNECLIGMGAIILDHAKIGDRSLIGAGALVTKKTEIPPGSLVMGSPAKVVRQLTEEEQAGLRKWAEKYIHVARAHSARMRAAKD